MFKYCIICVLIATANPSGNILRAVCLLAAVTKQTLCSHTHGIIFGASHWFCKWVQKPHLPRHIIQIEREGFLQHSQLYDCLGVKILISGFIIHFREQRNLWTMPRNPLLYKTPKC